MQITDELMDLCSHEDTYGFLKLNELNIEFMNTSNLRILGYNGGSVKIYEPISIEQTAEELETQKIVYDFVHEHNNFSLKRFGVKDKAKELYIEIPIDYIDNKEDPSNAVKNLNSISDSLSDKIRSNTISKQYIQNNNVNMVTISFYVPWNDDQFVTFNHKLEN